MPLTPVTSSFRGKYSGSVSRLKADPKDGNHQ